MKINHKTYSDVNERFKTDKWGKRELVETYTFSNSFSDEEIDYIHQICQSIPVVNAEIGSDHEEYNVIEEVRTSSVRWVPVNEETKFIYDRMYEMVVEANDALWGFDLDGFIEDIQYTEYHGTENGHYDWHLDIGEEVDYRKISITVQLSGPEEYDGGELEFLKGPYVTQVPKEKGLASLFPSYLLHRVSNVNKGVRRSLVLWVTGPALR